MSVAGNKPWLPSTPPPPHAEPILKQPADAPPASSAIVGTCSMCGQKKVTISHPPMGRCIDKASCEMTCARNARPHVAHARAYVKMHPRGKTPFYLKRVVILPPSAGETDKRIRGLDSFELVPDIREASVFDAPVANRLAQVWGGTPMEVSQVGGKGAKIQSGKK